MKNPIIDGRYADPEARVYNGKVYIYVTRSLPFEEQHNLDLIVSEDLIHFTKKESILDMSTFKGETFAIWAPRWLHSFWGLQPTALLRRL